jgi:hypothetical protein
VCLCCVLRDFACKSSLILQFFTSNRRTPVIAGVSTQRQVWWTEAWNDSRDGFWLVVLTVCLMRCIINFSLWPLQGSSHITANGTDYGTYCAYVNNKVATEPDTGAPIISSNLEYQTPSVPLSIVRCQGEHEYCYTLFYLDPTDKARHTILMQGKLVFDVCWSAMLHIYKVCKVANMNQL